MVHYAHMGSRNRLISHIFSFFGIVFFSALGAVPKLSAQDTRPIPIRAIILMDRSAVMTDHLEESARWLNSEIVDEGLRIGDTVSLWCFADKAELVIEMELSDPAALLALKTAIASVRTLEVPVDYAAAAAALHQALSRTAGRVDVGEAGTAMRDGPAILVVMTTTLLLDSASVAGNETSLRSLIEYSRIEDQPGWKAVFISVNIAERVEAAVRAYMKKIGE